MPTTAFAHTATTSKELDLYLATEGLVVGQERARKQMAELLGDQWDAVQHDKVRINRSAILSGESGTGKTFCSKLMCEHLGLPYAEADATRYTESGYKGLDLQHLFMPLLEAAARQKDGSVEDRLEGLGKAPQRAPSVLKRADIDEIIEIAQTGVILLDEFDKWMLRINHVTGEKDKAIQAELLKMIEGSIEYVSDSDEEVGVQFDTSRVLIICAGAFVGLFQQVHKRLGGDADDKTYLYQDNFWNQIVPEDFERYGLLPELAGRLSTHIFTRRLKTEDMREILMRDGGLLGKYRARYESLGCEWGLTDASVIHLVAESMKRATGARALDHVCAKMLGGELLFEAATSESRKRLVLEPSMVRGELHPL
jgi:ATP-dependent Clp protease ATP-binding subunit ClpX